MTFLPEAEALSNFVAASFKELKDGVGWDDLRLKLATALQNAYEKGLDLALGYVRDIQCTCIHPDYPCEACLAIKEIRAAKGGVK